MIYRVTHTTRYSYMDAVSQCYNLAHLLPRSTHFQTCTRASIRVNPVPVNCVDRVDYFGNNTFHFSVQDSHKTLEVTATSDVEIIAPHGWFSDRRSVIHADCQAVSRFISRYMDEGYQWIC